MSYPSASRAIQYSPRCYSHTIFSLPHSWSIAELYYKEGRTWLKEVRCSVVRRVFRARQVVRGQHQHHKVAFHIMAAVARMHHPSASSAHWLHNWRMRVATPEVTGHSFLGPLSRLPPVRLAHSARSCQYQLTPRHRNSSDQNHDGGNTPSAGTCRRGSLVMRASG